MKTTLVLLIAFVFMNYSCESHQAILKSEQIEAVILDGGPIPTENCGWIIKVNNTYYSPANLSKEFEKDKTIVLIKYEVLNEDFICGNTTTYRAYKKIKILEISKK
ncbi:hypothetical protein [Flavobacterium granuli]|uniref:Uncharacterized protein n=1 Tax=Flavobacterium granuli TaxID=280093 RepID=A0A1M5LPH7_9FLAO|nr:hypothetical protein [Flavobacterium granuli]PRZ24052.1 hypothetical protein BC624_104167 [Flavobacterium granuli]SHG66790.1 hypothetical protein SAMN05443373_103167 [Flavobacterium granuli]